MRLLGTLQYHKEYELLFPYHACEEAEVLWRLSRLSILCRDTVMRVGGHYESCTRQALRLASAARTLAPQNAMCHLVSRPFHTYSMPLVRAHVLYFHEYKWTFTT